MSEQQTVSARIPEVRREERGHAFYPPAAVLGGIPALYATDGVPAWHKTIHAHYFAAWGDWYVAEFDPASGEAYGWSSVTPDAYLGDWGYIDLPALESYRSERGLPGLVERDLYFEPVIAAACLPEGHRPLRCKEEACRICRAPQS